jgi:hypothetical protein
MITARAYIYSTEGTVHPWKTLSVSEDGWTPKGPRRHARGAVKRAGNGEDQSASGFPTKRNNPTHAKATFRRSVCFDAAASPQPAQRGSAPAGRRRQVPACRSAGSNPAGEHAFFWQFSVPRPCHAGPCHGTVLI